MFLSFIVPVYNAEKYLEECLHSLLEQDIPREAYEIICVNDGSTDGSLSILLAFQKAHSNLIVIDRKNAGVATARNVGLDAARGEYIWFVDSDDFIKPNILRQLQQKAAETNCDRLIFGAYQFTDTLTEEEAALSRQNKLSTNTSWYDSVVWRSLLRRDFLQNCSLCFHYPDLTHGEDGLFMYEVTLHSPKSVEIGDVLYFYREHSGSAETTVSLENQQKKLHSHIKITKILEEYFLSGSQSGQDSANKFMSFLWTSLYEISKLPAKESRKYLNELKQAGLFPYRRPKQCTMTQSYMVSRSNWLNKGFDRLYLHLHTRFGFAAMHMLQQLIRLKNGIRKKIKGLDM